MTIRDQIQSALTEAMKAQDTVAVGALRSALSAIGNAEALPVSIVPSAGAIESAVALGSAESDRLLLDDDQQREVVEKEVAERETAITHYDELGRSDASEKLRAEVATLRDLLAGRPHEA
ncbi:GatB/YqeY domain-containing protein [Aestuariimicrobium sp. T2.26MG-19.2B]|uniref:GatB/YqeY domain-containing protein n=1 Tax=Aestuariimicrobium sp. T2.26MG-19.2B TaxID=3040679 RepID=UPI0024774F13|nr:GatB/YqeY domain-containing protein [Aestuariimicrobium sp. T2.26MG-19.2B]CAI9400325.1 hypothetical protein AESSP_00366 [Aestuariimicrobium sp. T2.26MG-19.2B]